MICVVVQVIISRPSRITVEPLLFLLFLDHQTHKQRRKKKKG